MKDILKYTIWAGIYAVLIVPFIVAGEMLFPYITGKAFAFRIIVEIIFGLWLILIMKDSEFRPKFSWILASLGIFAFVFLIADINAIAPFKAFWSNYERMEGWVSLIHLFLYFLVLVSMFNTKERWLWFLRANVIAGSVMAIWSLNEGAKEAVVRVAGPLGNPIYISIYFLFIFFFSTILWHKDVLARHLTTWAYFKNVYAKILFYIYPLIAILSFYVIYRTSRGVLLGAIGGLLVTAILIAVFEKEKIVIKQISFGLIIAVTAVIIIFLSFRETQFVKNNPTLSRLAEVSWSNVNGQARQYIWPMAFKGFKEKPILGWGQEGFNYVFNKYYDPRMYNQETWFDRAHNAPLDALVAGGALGLLSYLFIFGAAIYSLWFRRNGLDVPSRAIFTGIYAGYFFQALFVFDTLMSYIMFATALAYIHSRLVFEEKPKKVSGQLVAIFKDEEYQNYIFIPVVVIMLGIAIWFVNIPALKANRSLIQALRLTQSGRVDEGIKTFKYALSFKSLGDSEIREQLLTYAPGIVSAKELSQKTKEEFLNLTFFEVDKQIKRVPMDARYYILAGSALNNIGGYSQALPYIEKAIELSPLKQAMRFELVRALYSLGKKDEALLEAKKAYDLEPNYAQAKEIYDSLLSESKK